jgi:hypothetical protein
VKRNTGIYVLCCHIFALQMRKAYSTGTPLCIYCQRLGAFGDKDSNLQGLVLEIAFFWLVSSGSGERRKEASLDHDLTAFTCGAVLGLVETTLNSFNTRPGLTKRTNVVDGVTHFTALPHNGHPSGVALEDSGCS